MSDDDLKNELERRRNGSVVLKKGAATGYPPSGLRSSSGGR